ncbi:hypothetical protein MRX96_029552 [Rhipicephalus microplus]
MKMVASLTNSGVLEAVNATKNTVPKCSFHDPSRANGRTLLSDDDPDVPRHVSWSGPSIRRALTLRARRLENGCRISAGGTFSTITFFPLHV